MSRFQIERSQVWKLLLGTVGCAAAITAYLGRADAQSNADDCGVLGKNCSFTISDNAVQKVPTLFKIQAQISQAKIPLGDAIFSKLVVNVKSGNTQLCTENFSQVRVRSGVLNLEVGRNIQGCQLDDVVAKYNDLAFQVCIGDSSSEAGNCLKPIQLSSVPYAIKASFASQAQESYRSEVAARSHYAQRVAADGSNLVNSRLGIGYYDFQTPAADKLTTLTAVPGAVTADVKGAFAQWTPVDPLNKILNFSAKNPTTNVLERLTKTIFHSVDTGIWGRLAVTDTSNFAKLSTFQDGVTVSGGVANILVPANMTKPVTMANTLGVTGAIQTGSTFTANGLVTANNGITVASGLVDVQTSAAFGKTGLSTSVTFRSGTTVDMSAATVLMPASAPPSFPVKSLTASATSGNCATSTVAAGAKMCAISQMRLLAVGATNGCWISTVTTPSAGLQLNACSANCAAMCF